MASTYEPIATTTLSSAASSITFSSIPGTYTDLRLVFVATATTANAPGAVVNFNADNGTNYSRTRIQGDGTSATSSRSSNASFIQLTSGTGLSNTIPTLRTLDLFSYAGSTFKTCLTTENSDLNGSGTVVRAVQMWRSTSAVTSLVIDTKDVSETFAIGTTATLYGILKA